MLTIYEENNSKTERKRELTVDGDVERTGHHFRRRLWPGGAEVQLSLTPERCSAVASVQREGNGGGHVHRGPGRAHVAATDALTRAACHVQ